MDGEAERGQRGGRPWALIVLLAGGALFGLLMALLTGASPGQSTGAAARPGSYDTTATPQNLALNQRAPDFTARTPDGGTVRLSDLRGSMVALNFWATWCEPCEIEMPDLQRAAERYAGAGLVVLGVNQGETAGEVSAYLDERGLTFPVVLDEDESIAARYGVRALPTTYWIDGDGVVRARHIGMLDANLIDAYVDELRAPVGG